MSRYTKLAFLLLALSGCARTEITDENVSHIENTPYHKILVCMIAGTPQNATLMEKMMIRRLKKHDLAAESCTDIFPSLRDNSPDQVVTNIQRHEYDAVLIIQRKPMSAYATLKDFVVAYSSGIPPFPKTSENIEGVALLMGVHENAPVWKAEGLLYAETDEPIANVMKAFARTIDDGLGDTGIYPSE